MYRAVVIPERADGMRVDRFLTAMFDWSRNVFARAIKAGQVRLGSEERVLRASYNVKTGDQLRLYIPGIAPDGPPPPFPEVLFEDDRVVAINKPPAMVAHPNGTKFRWAVISLAKVRWPGCDLVHRLDQDTSGVMLLSKDREANRFLKAQMEKGGVHKEYLAITKGIPDWEAKRLTGPIGPAGGEIRIQMAVTPDGLPSRTDAEVLKRGAEMALVRCRLHTGRTHQIRVHLAHAGFPLVGDRLYGVPPEVFLHSHQVAVDDWVFERSGAPRHALHSHYLALKHPDGGSLEVRSELPDDMQRWWETPEVLPLDQS